MTPAETPAVFHGGPLHGQTRQVPYPPPRELHHESDQPVWIRDWRSPHLVQRHRHIKYEHRGTEVIGGHMFASYFTAGSF